MHFHIWGISYVNGRKLRDRRIFYDDATVPHFYPFLESWTTVSTWLSLSKPFPIGIFISLSMIGKRKVIVVHQLIKLVEIDQDLVIHPVQTVIQVGLLAVIVTVIRIQLFDLFQGLPLQRGEQQKNCKNAIHCPVI